MKKPRQKGLGRDLNVPARCYAEGIAGPCRGQLVLAHPLTRAVAPHGVFDVQIRRQPPDATDWTLESSTTVRMDDASALILCDGHNNDLSPADGEAVKAVRAMLAARAGTTERTMPNLILLTRWLCAVAAGSVAITGHKQPEGTVAHPDLIRYAFGLETSAPLHFFRGVRVAGVPLASRHELTISTFRTFTGGPEAYHVGLFELDAIVSTIPGRAPEMGKVFDARPGLGYFEWVLPATAA